MNNDRDLVRRVTEQIRELCLVSEEIERTLERHTENRLIAQEGEDQRGPPIDSLVRDRDGNSIHLGEQVP